MLYYKWEVEHIYGCQTLQQHIEGCVRLACVRVRDESRRIKAGYPVSMNDYYNDIAFAHYWANAMPSERMAAYIKQLEGFVTK